MALLQQQATNVEIRIELLMAVREILRNAIMTMAALRDPDARFLGWKHPPTIAVQSVYEAYGYASASVRSFHPSPAEIAQAERVASWLAWLRRIVGPDALHRFTAWSLGVPIWRIAQREGCGERQIMRRIDRSVAEIILEFTGVDIPVEQTEEPIKGAPTFAVIFQKPDRSSAAHTGQAMKIYIGGRGMWRNGRWLRDGTHRLNKFII